MENNTLILLGGNKLNTGILHYCKEHSYRVVVVDWNSDAALKGDLFLCIDVKDSTAILAALKQHHIHNILGAYTSIDLAVGTVSAIHNHYGLPHPTTEAIRNATSKQAMTQCWQQQGLLNRYSQTFTSITPELTEQAQTMPLIIKPNVSSGSRDITILPPSPTPEQLQQAFHTAQEGSFDHNVIVEEYLQGQEFTCEMLGDSNGNVSVYAISVKYHTPYNTHNKIAVKLHYNSIAYPPETYQYIAQTAKLCYQALGLTASQGHLEIILKPDGTLSPIEIGARSSGYIAHPLVSLVAKQDYFGNYLAMLQGVPINEQDHINGEYSSMYYFYDLPPHTVSHHPCHLMNFLPPTITSIDHNRTTILQPEHTFNLIGSDNERPGYEILFGQKKHLTIEAIEAAEQQFIQHLAIK